MGNRGSLDQTDGTGAISHIISKKRLVFWVWNWERKFATYMTPILMATATPIFSRLYMWNFIRSFHGRNARMRSQIVPQTRQQQTLAKTVGSQGRQTSQISREVVLPPHMMPYVLLITSGQQVPGLVKFQLLGKGLHRIQKNIAAA